MIPFVAKEWRRISWRGITKALVASAAIRITKAIVSADDRAA